MTPLSVLGLINILSDLNSSVIHHSVSQSMIHHSVSQSKKVSQTLVFDCDFSQTGNLSLSLYLSHFSVLRSDC